MRNHLLVARPTTITNAQILAAARALFLEKGIRATTAEVARRAGVAEGSIFKRFKTKEELFSAAMLKDEAPPFIALLEERSAGDDLEKTMLEVGVAAIEFFRTILPSVMMAWSNAGTVPELLRGPNPPPVRTVRALSAFFASEIRARRIRKTDPEVLARIFLGSIQSYVFFELLGQPLPLERAYLRRVIRVLWDGVSAWKSEERSRTGSSHSPRSSRRSKRGPRDR